MHEQTVSNKEADIVNNDTGDAKEENMNIRLLRANEIECRVATVNEKGVSLLLYKDARVDQKILDETFSMFGWKRTHQCIDGNLYCTVEIYDEKKKQWIAKQDVGTTSYAEKEKGQASDSFKRACFNIGIGRELYSAPFIWIPAYKVDISKKGDRYVANDRFSVQSISYDDHREIESLVIINGSGQIVFDKAARIVPIPEKKESLTKSQKALLEKELVRTGVPLETVLKRYGINDINSMTKEIYDKAMRGLKKTESKQAA